MNKAEKISQFLYYHNFIHYFESQGIEKRIYFDCRDVISMLIGMKSMISSKKDLDEKIYKDDSTLVYSLLYGGWFNEVYLTTPHQEELYNHIYNSFSFDIVDEEDIKEFWLYVNQITGLNESDFDKKLPLHIYLNKLKDKSNDLYIANYLLRETNWKRRFSYLKNKQKIIFEQRSDNFMEILKSDIFTKIFTAFKLLRPSPNSSKNNLTDAFVLCCIHNRVQLYKQNKISYIPILYDSKKLFQRVIAEAEIQEEFYCRFDDANFNIICDSEFLIYTALFNRRDKIQLSLKDVEMEEYASYKNFSDILFSQKKLGEDFVLEYEKEIEDFKHSRLLQICWINSKEDVHELIENLISIRKQNLRSVESRDLINTQVNFIIAELKGKVENYSIFREAYEKINSSYLTITRLFTPNLGQYENRGHDLDVMNDMSLTRFSVKKENCKTIRRICRELLLSNEGESKNHLIIYIVQGIIAGLEEGSKDSAMISLMVLWILGEYRLIKKILDKYEGKYTHYSEAFLHAAVIAKSFSENHYECKKLKNIIACVDNYSADTKFSENYKTSIAASYIYFQLWVKKSNKNFRVLYSEPEEINNKEVNTYFHQAITLAKAAIQWLEGKIYKNDARNYRKSKYYYILNNYIYYMTMGAKNDEFKDIEVKVNILEAVEFDHPEYWQYRYHDTLALYYFRKALAENYEPRFESYKETAFVRISNALEWVFGVEDQRDYLKLKSKIETSHYQKGKGEKK